MISLTSSSNKLKYQNIHFPQLHPTIIAELLKATKILLISWWAWSEQWSSGPVILTNTAQQTLFADLLKDTAQHSGHCPTLEQSWWHWSKLFQNSADDHNWDRVCNHSITLLHHFSRTSPDNSSHCLTSAHCTPVSHGLVSMIMSKWCFLQTINCAHHHLSPAHPEQFLWSNTPDHMKLRWFSIKHLNFVVSSHSLDWTHRWPNFTWTRTRVSR